jgi:hypothetical protein
VRLVLLKQIMSGVPRTRLRGPKLRLRCLLSRNGISCTWLGAFGLGTWTCKIDQAADGTRLESIEHFGMKINVTKGPTSKLGLVSNLGG